MVCPGAGHAFGSDTGLRRAAVNRDADRLGCRRERFASTCVAAS